MKNSLKLQVYIEIKDKILNNEYEQGSYLEEKMLATTFGVSRTPIREAISMLEKENLVQIIPKKGIFVTTLNLQAINELFQARYILEPESLKLAIDYLDTNYLKELQSKFFEEIKNEDYKSLHKLDYEFHNYINHNCTNRYIRQALDSVSDNFQRVRTQNFYQKERTIGGAEEHLEIIDFIINGNVKLAQEALMKHISATEKYYIMSK